MPITAELAPISEVDETVTQATEEETEVSIEEIEEFDIAGATFGTGTETTDFVSSKK